MFKYYGLIGLILMIMVGFTQTHAYPTQSISTLTGRITDYLAKPYANVELQSSTGSTIRSDDRGVFTTTLELGTTITPTLAGYMFIPASATIGNGVTINFEIFREPIVVAVAPASTSTINYVNTQGQTVTVNLRNNDGYTRTFKYQPVKLPRIRGVGDSLDEKIIYQPTTFSFYLHELGPNPSQNGMFYEFTFDYRAEDIPFLNIQRLRLLYDYGNNWWSIHNYSCLAQSYSNLNHVTGYRYQGTWCHYGYFSLAQRGAPTYLPSVIK